MDKVFVGILGAIGVAGLFFVAAILGTLCGGIAGWAVGMAFPEVIALVKGYMGVTVTDFQLGAALGFVGSFFRSSNTNNAS